MGCSSKSSRDIWRVYTYAYVITCMSLPSDMKVITTSHCSFLIQESPMWLLKYWSPSFRDYTRNEIIKIIN